MKSIKIGSNHELNFSLDVWEYARHLKPFRFYPLAVGDSYDRPGMVFYSVSVRFLTATIELTGYIQKQF